MKHLTETPFFILLKGNKDNPSALQQEYDKFALLIFSETKTANDLETYHDSLVYTHIELSCLTPESKKNVAVFLEKAIILLDIQIERLEKQKFADSYPHNNETFFGKKLKWTLNISAYVEWVYGLGEILNLNGCKVKFSKLFRIFNPIFGMKLTNFSSYFNIIKSRKKGERSLIFDKQKELLNQRMDEADNTPSKK
jgi:hypothetical protein